MMSESTASRKTWWTMPRAAARLGIRPADGVLLVCALLSVGGFVLVSAAYDKIGFPLDDSWIHQVYARNLAEHGEWAYIPGKASAASSSPLYTLALAVGYLLGVSPFLWAHLLGALALFGVGALAMRLAEQLFPEVEWVGPGAGALVIFSWHLIWAAASGMETVIFAMVALGVISLVWRESRMSFDRWQDVFRRGMVLGVAGGVLYLTRPEGIGLLGLSVIFIWFSRLHRRYQTFLAWCMGMALGAAVIMIPYVLMNLSLVGEPLPSTVSAKIAQGGDYRDEYNPLARYGIGTLVIIAGAQFAWLPGVAGGLFYVAKRDAPHRLLYFLPPVWALAHHTVFVLVLPVQYHHGRYVMPILPAVLLYGVGGMLLFLRAKDTPLKRVATRTLFLSAVLAVPGFWWIGGKAYGEDVRIINTEMVKTSKWIAYSLPQDELLATHDIGAVGYFAPRRDIFDIAGLVSPAVVPVILDGEAVMRMMCEKGVKWLMVLPAQSPAALDDSRLEEVYSTNEPYMIEAGGSGNMAVYRLHFQEGCGR